MNPEHRFSLLSLGLITLALLIPQFGFSLETEPTAQSTQRPGLQRELMLEREFSVRPGGTLSIDVPDGDVTVRTGANNRAVVKVYMIARDVEWGRDVFERMDFQIGQRNGVVDIRARDARIRRNEWRRHHQFGVEVHVETPAQFNMDILTRDGDIDVGDKEGRIEIESADGDLYLGSLRGPEISAKTMDGDVHADSLSAEHIRVYTQDGDIDVAAASGILRIDSGDGDIRLRLIQSGDVSLHTRDGNITVYADPQLRANIDIEGEEVRLGSAFTVTGRVTDRGVRGTLNGGGPKLEIRTGDGTVMLRRW